MLLKFGQPVSMPFWEKIGKAWVLHAGAGEWYNQPHNKKWDMGEDAQELPSPELHIELQKGSESSKYSSSKIVVDLTVMFWLVSHDWGFLPRLSKL